MRKKEVVESELQNWKGVNKYIENKLLQELKEIEDVEAQEKLISDIPQKELPHPVVMPSKNPVKADIVKSKVPAKPVKKK